MEPTFSSEFRVSFPFSQAVRPFPGHADPVFRANGSAKLELPWGRASGHVEDNIVHLVKSCQLFHGGSRSSDKVPQAQVGLWGLERQ